jgi:hypothetical protein
MPTEAIRGPELGGLIASARSNNAEHGISGLLHIESETITQWIEGPEGKISDLLLNLHRDPRHRDLKVLKHEPIERRVFGGWPMLLAAAPQDVVVDLQPTLALRRRVEAASEGEWGTVLGGVGSSRTSGTPPPPISGGPFTPLAGDISEDADWGPAASALARLLLDDGIPEAVKLVDRLVSRQSDPLRSLIAIFERTDALLSELWSDDGCDEADIILAQAALIRILRQQRWANPIVPWIAAPPSVMVATVPGELHLLPAILDAEVLRAKGWVPKLAFPRSGSDLVEELGRAPVDVLDLTLSGVFERKERSFDIAKLIASLRAGAGSTLRKIILRGAMAKDHPEDALSFGIDAAAPSANEIDRVIDQAWGNLADC